MGQKEVDNNVFDLLVLDIGIISIKLTIVLFAAFFFSIIDGNTTFRIFYIQNIAVIILIYLLSPKLEATNQFFKHFIQFTKVMTESLNNI